MRRLQKEYGAIYHNNCRYLEVLHRGTAATSVLGPKEQTDGLRVVIICTSRLPQTF